MGADAGPKVSISCPIKATGESGMFLCAASSAHAPGTAIRSRPARRGSGAAMASAIRIAAPWLPAGKQAALGRRQQAEGDRGEVKDDCVLGDEGEAGDGAGREQPARALFGLDDAHRNSQPGRRLERVRYQENAEELQRAAC